MKTLLTAQKDITTVTIPESVTKIGDYTFYDCASLPDITLPDNVTEIGFSAFNECSNLTSVTFKDTAGWKGIEIDEEEVQKEITLTSSKLTNITIKTQPVKTEYTAGETFAPAGLYLQATYTTHTPTAYKRKT